MEQVFHEPTVAAPSDAAAFVKEAQVVFGSEYSTSQQLEEIQQCYEICEKKLQSDGQLEVFEMIEVFVRDSNKEGKERRTVARKVAATAEKHMAAELASMKSIRKVRERANHEQELQQKIGNTERSNLRRKMVMAKSSQVASAECRLQFASNRAFMETLHEKKQDDLHRQYKSKLFLIKLLNRLQGKDSRFCALEEQIEQRVYQKKKADANEHHMAQSLEEAQYLEAVLGLLDKVQAGKEEAARCLLELQVPQLKETAASADERNKELELFYASCKLEIAKLTASSLENDEEEEETETSRQVMVERLERRKEFFDCSAVMSISQLYDDALWSVATASMGLSSSNSHTYSEGSSIFSEAQEALESSSDEKELQGQPQKCEVGFWNDDSLSETGSVRRVPAWTAGYAGDEDGSTCTETTIGGAGSTLGTSCGQRSPIEEMQMKQLKREIYSRERALLKKHKTEKRREKRAHRAAVRALKHKHQCIINSLLENSLAERQMLRQGIKKRLNQLVQRQAATMAELEDAIEKDLRVMREALLEENRRLVDTKEESFADAKALISEQTFHEVRNA